MGATRQRIHIVGIGDDGLEGLTNHARELIGHAQLLVGSEQTLRRVPKQAGGNAQQRLAVTDNLSAAVEAISARPDDRVVVLASGDPMFYGVARFLCDKIGKEHFEVVPHVSSMQLAFARVKESWEDAYLTDLANHPLDTVVEKIRIASTVGLFTTETATPAAVSQRLLDRGIDYYTAYVCENLGSPDERVTHAELRELAAQEFAPLNVMVLVRKPNAPDRPSDRVGQRTFGNPDDAFRQSKPKQGLLTPAEVRTLALAELDLGPSSIVWDVGAGSGSVAIEAAQLASLGTTYAIEMDAADHRLIMDNAATFRVRNLTAVLDRAPEAFEKLPDPDAVFVGGLGREITQTVEQACRRLRPGGRLVANVASIENVGEVHAALHAQCGDVNVWLINVARGMYQMERIRFNALNPTFLLSVRKPPAPKGAK